MEDLLSELIRVQCAGGTKGQARPTVPGFLCSKFDRPIKEDAVKEKQTRFYVANDTVSK